MLSLSSGVYGDMKRTSIAVARRRDQVLQRLRVQRPRVRDVAV